MSVQNVTGPGESPTQNVDGGDNMQPTFDVVCGGGIRDRENHFMKISSIEGLPEPLNHMFSDKSKIVNVEFHSDRNIVTVRSEEGFISHFNQDYFNWVKETAGDDMYLSSIPKAGLRWNGGCLFVKLKKSKQISGRLRLYIDKTVWYALAPLDFETVKL